MPRRPSALANWWLLSRSLASVVVRVERTRRQLLFILTLVLLVLVALGSMPWWDFLKQRPWWFVAYWGLVCALAIFAFLLALLDLLAVRQRFRTEMRRLKTEYRDVTEEGDRPRDDKKD